MIIGTAGHIDHGKTALVKALTGVDADRLQEEKLRGITIDLGFAYKPLANGQILGFVDVPGHEKFIHNMLAGATGIDYVMLVVAADDGPMPQTREHLQILNLLGISRGVVALTKSDLVSLARITEVTAQIQTLLKTTSLASARVILVSSVSGEGVETLNENLLAAANALPIAAPHGYFRLAVDRSFTLQGIGVVVTGTVFSGQVKVGDRLIVSPSGDPVRVRAIHAQNRASTSGRAGQRCALNLSGVEKSEVKRGNWVLAPEIHEPTSRFDSQMTVSPDEEKPLAHWTPVHLHLAAANVSARVALLESDSLQPGASAFAQLVLDEAIGALRGDRFIIRDQSASRTIGGGIVLDPFGPERGRRKPERLRWLSALGKADLHGLLDLSPAGLDLTQLAVAWNLTPKELESLTSNVVHVSLGEKMLGFSRQRWDDLLSAVVEALRKSPNGATPEALRAALPGKISKVVFIALLEQLARENRVLRDGPLVRLPGQDPGLSEEEAALWERASSILKQAGLQPPRIAELGVQLRIDESKLKSAFKRFVEKGLLRQVSEQIYFPSDTIAQIAKVAEELASCNPNGIFTVAQFRTASGLSRNLTLPVLESFDRWGFTLRVGDGRKIRREWAAVK